MFKKGCNKETIIAFERPQPKCKKCDNLAHFARKSKLGFSVWHPYCKNCIKENKKKYKYKSKPKEYRKYLKSVCEFCGFKPIHTCQLDIDHKDCNKKNNSPSNLQTLCANCHRLKTQLNKDFLNKKYRGI